MSIKIQKEIEKELLALCDKDFRDFSSRTIPSVPIENMLGIRTPELRDLAKRLSKREDIGDFLEALPHKYFEEYQLHAFIISLEKDYDRCIDRVNAFLPFVDNWATCDQMNPKVFKKHHKELLPHIDKWLSSEKTYEIRFGIKMLMDHFLEEDFLLKYPEAVSKIRSEEYYVNMMVAWYFATALAKQYDAILPFIEEYKLDTWTHNKAIQKAVESYRITDEQKTYLKSLKIKGR